MKPLPVTSLIEVMAVSLFAHRGDCMSPLLVSAEFSLYSCQHREGKLVGEMLSGVVCQTFKCVKGNKKTEVIKHAMGNA